MRIIRDENGNVYEEVGTGPIDLASTIVFTPSLIDSVVVFVLADKFLEKYQWYLDLGIVRMLIIVLAIVAVFFFLFNLPIWGLPLVLTSMGGWGYFWINRLFGASGWFKDWGIAWKTGGVIVVVLVAFLFHRGLLRRSTDAIRELLCRRNVNYENMNNEIYNKSRYPLSFSSGV